MHTLRLSVADDNPGGRIPPRQPRVWKRLQVRMERSDAMHGCAMTAGLLILLRLTSPGLPAPVHGTTDADQTWQRWHTRREPL